MGVTVGAVTKEDIPTMLPMEIQEEGLLRCVRRGLVPRKEVSEEKMLWSPPPAVVVVVSVLVVVVETRSILGRISIVRVEENSMGLVRCLPMVGRGMDGDGDGDAAPVQTGDRAGGGGGGGRGSSLLSRSSMSQSGTVPLDRIDISSGGGPFGTSVSSLLSHAGE